MSREDDIKMSKIIEFLLAGNKSTEEMCEYVLDLMRTLSNLTKDSEVMRPGFYPVTASIWGKCMIFCMLVWRYEND